MQYLIIDAAQDPDFPHKKKFDGASVGCWIKNQTTKNTYLIAKGWIENLGWIVLSLEDQQIVSAEDYEENPEGRKYFEQATSDSEVFVFYTSPSNSSG